jgi:hypothetical protein
MTFIHPFARASIWLALFASANLAYAADKIAALPNPADADAIIPATSYQSAMDFRPASTGSSSPAENWIRLNQQVGAPDSMALTVDGSAVPSGAAPAINASQAGAAAYGPIPRAQAAPGNADPHARHNRKDAK